MSTTLQNLERSPFFEVFAPNHLSHLAKHAEVKDFDANIQLFNEGDVAEHFYMLVEGEIKLYFTSSKDDVLKRPDVHIQNIFDPGRPIGWSCMVEPHHYRASAFTVKPTKLIVFKHAFLKDMCHQFPKFGVVFMRRILWVLGNRLRATRVRLVAKRYEKETMAIRALLDQSAETLHVNSPLHKIPHYLESRLTLADAFQCLEVVKVNGEPNERTLAGLCLDILENVKKELAIYQSLQSIYENVASAPDDLSSEEIRESCCEEFINLFQWTDYIIKGEENLPKESGNLFIMNHLYNHPDNMLPNHFQLNHDVHFVSCMIIYKKYKKAAIRVIRSSFKDEFGHKKYYERLGHIMVDPPDPSLKDPKIKAEKRQEFLDICKEKLASGENISICPEGEPSYTKDSPRPFKAGAFRIAQYVRPEPWIVPVVLANFDKKFSQTKIVAIIHEPFKLSTFLPDNAPDDKLFEFVNDYNRKYKTYVQEALDLAWKDLAASS